MLGASLLKQYAGVEVSWCESKTKLQRWEVIRPVSGSRPIVAHTRCDLHPEICEESEPNGTLARRSALYCCFGGWKTSEISIFSVKLKLSHLF